MQHPETDTSPSGPHWGEKEQTVSVPVPLMTGTALSHYFGILASEGNPASYVQAIGINNISSAVTDYKSWFGLGLDSRGPVPKTLEKKKSSASSRS